MLHGGYRYIDEPPLRRESSTIDTGSVADNDAQTDDSGLLSGTPVRSESLEANPTVTDPDLLVLLTTLQQMNFNSDVPAFDSQQQPENILSPTDADNMYYPLCPMSPLRAPVADPDSFTHEDILSPSIVGMNNNSWCFFASRAAIVEDTPVVEDAHVSDAVIDEVEPECTSREMQPV
jgi:hypothetical protein